MKSRPKFFLFVKGVDGLEANKGSKFDVMVIVFEKGHTGTVTMGFIDKTGERIA
jgi:hypothetical protein